MKGYISIFIEDVPSFDEKVSVNRGFLHDYDYCIEFYSDIDESVYDLINDKSTIETLEESIDFISTVAEEEDLEFYSDMKKKIKNEDFFTNCSRFYLHGDIEEIGEYLDNNALYFFDKEIILAGYLSLDEDILCRLEKSFKSFPNIKLNVRGNYDFVTINEYKATIAAINQIVDKIKNYDYTPFEQLIYAYDLIRDRFYIREGEDEKASVSRDLTSSLLGDKIVCLGFANIFKAICDKLGLNNMVFRLDSGEVGHARNLVYLVDDEYEINGLYFFDPTFDCKKDEENRFLFSYKHFAKTASEMNVLSRKEWKYVTYKYLDSNEIDELVLSVPESKLDTMSMLQLISSTKINTMLDITNQDKINPMVSMTGDEFLEKMYSISDLANIPINSNQFIKALYKVRRQQYYEEPLKYLFDIDVLTCILINSKFIVGDTTPEDDIFSAIGIDRRYTIFTGKEKIMRYLEENNLDKDMERVKLVRTIKTIYEQKKEEEKRLEKKMF